MRDQKNPCTRAPGAPGLPCMCPRVARGAREPWRPPGACADEWERRRSAARPRDRIAGAGDLDTARARIRAGRSVLPRMCPCVARGAREPWRSPGACEDESERRRSAARPQERVAGAGDLDPARARMRSLTPPAPGAAAATSPGMGGTCTRRQRTDLFGEDGARCAGRGQRLPGTALIDDPMLAHVPH